MTTTRSCSSSARSPERSGGAISSWRSAWSHRHRSQPSNLFSCNSVSLSNPSDFAVAFAAEQNIYSERQLADLDRRAQAAPPDGT
eukprot:9503158-Pyramimonas_sp.AAC.1